MDDRLIIAISAVILPSGSGGLTRNLAALICVEALRARLPPSLTAKPPQSYSSRVFLLDRSSMGRRYGFVKLFF
jgi:hypothetical protein